jgi:hypothetical protein
MASIVSAGTTSATALNMSADTTGILQLASNNGTVALTVTTAQRIGVGTTGPATKLEVSDGAVTAGAGGFVLYGRNSSSFPSNGGGYFCLTTNNVSADSGGMTVLTNNAGTLTERMSIDYLGVIKAGASGTAEVFAQNTLKVWGSIVGSNGTLYNSFGISSSSRVSTGVYQINFTRTLGSSRFGSAGSQYGSGIVFINNESTTGCRVNTANTSGTQVDADCQFLIAGGS